MQPEKQLENDIIRYLWSKDIYAFKIKSMGTFDPVKKRFRRPSPFYKKGVSDILGCLPDGKMLAIEVKTKSGRLTPEQKIFLNDITQRKGVAGVCRSVQDVEILLGDYIARRMVTADSESAI